MKKILCVDDSPTILGILEKVISIYSGDFEVIKVVDSTLVSRYLESDGHNIEVIITDINMPKLSGYELVERIRGDDRWKNIKILVVSTEAQKESIVKMLRLGADSYVIKPFKPEDLISKMKVLLNDEKEHLSPEMRLLNFIRKSKTDYLEKQGENIGFAEKQKINAFVNYLENNILQDKDIVDLLK